MKSVADSLRKATRVSAAQLTTEERVAQALRLGDEDLAAYASSKGITFLAARLDVARSRSVGRRRSKSADPSTT